MTETDETAGLLRLVTDMRFALGDDGKRMQDDLLAFCVEMRKDAERYRWMKRNPAWLGWEHDFRPDEVEREIDAAMAANTAFGAA